MKVWIELHNGQEIKYQHVNRVDDSSERYKIIIYGENGVLAMLDKDGVKNLVTYDESNDDE